MKHITDEKEKKGDMVGLLSIHFSKMALGGPAHELSLWREAAYHNPHVEAAIHAHARAPFSCAAHQPGWIFYD